MRGPHVIASRTGERESSPRPGWCEQGPATTGRDTAGPSLGGTPAVSLRPEMVGPQPASTSMVTGTGLVSTSNTADRARDCSTIRRRTSAGASPLMAIRTRTPS